MMPQSERLSPKKRQLLARVNRAASVEVPAWVLPKDRAEYRRVSARDGEEEAAAFARVSKRLSVVCKEA